MIVEFDTVTEFMTELRKDRKRVVRKIVRITQVRARSLIAFVTECHVVATARVGQEIYRLDCFCGALCGLPEADQQTIDTTAHSYKKLKDTCARLGLDARTGVLDVPPCYGAHSNTMNHGQFS